MKIKLIIWTLIVVCLLLTISSISAIEFNSIKETNKKQLSQIIGENNESLIIRFLKMLVNSIVIGLMGIKFGFRLSIIALSIILPILFLLVATIGTVFTIVVGTILAFFGAIALLFYRIGVRLGILDPIIPQEETE